MTFRPHLVALDVDGTLVDSAPDLIGTLPAVLADPDARVHLYGKGVKPGRKVGHVTVLDADVEEARRRARAAAAVLEGERA